MRARAVLFTSDYHFLHLLKYQPIEQHPAGGWRWGSRRITQKTVVRLLASRRAFCKGGTIRLAPGPLPRSRRKARRDGRSQ